MLGSVGLKRKKTMKRRKREIENGYGGEDEELRGCPVSVLWSWLMRKRKKKGEGGCDCFT